MAVEGGSEVPLEESVLSGEARSLDDGEASERAEAEVEVEVEVSRTASGGKLGCSGGGCGELSGGCAECSAAECSSRCGDEQAGTTRKRATTGR